MTADGERTDYVFVARVDQAADVATTRKRLDRAGIPYQTALVQDDPPQVLFSVPSHRRREAAFALGIAVDEPDLASPRDNGRARFPAEAMQAACVPVAIHLLLYAWSRSGVPGGESLYAFGALIVGQTLLEPWRLLTSMWLHSDMPHLLWNGVSLVVFAVPLLSQFGWRNCGGLYLASGIGGSLAALALGTPGSWIIGSSGAVAGLFGAWTTARLEGARFAELEGRDRIRIAGIALLVLPALLNPSSADGQPISVSSHVGGLITGLAIGIWLGRRMRRSFHLAPVGSGADTGIREIRSNPDPEDRSSPW